MGPTSQVPDESAGNQSRMYPFAVFLTRSHERTKRITPWRICEGTTPWSSSEAVGTAVADECPNESIPLSFPPKGPSRSMPREVKQMLGGRLPSSSSEIRQIRHLVGHPGDLPLP